jgi:hypothetical protein
MINNYLSYLHEDKQDINEFVVLPIIMLSMHIYKKHTEHKRIDQYCVSASAGPERKKCFLKFKIEAIRKTIIEINKLKPKCEMSTNLKKCVSRIDKEIVRLTKEMSNLKTKLAKI